VGRWRRLHPRQWADVDLQVVLLATTVLGFAIAYELATIGNLPIFDRYALPALPPIGLLLILQARRSTKPASDATVAETIDTEHAPTDDLAPGPRTRAPIAIAATVLGVVLIAGLGVVYSGESASYDAGRWHAAEAAVRAGYPIADVDGGYEWVGYQKALGRAPEYATTVEQQQALRRQYFRGLCVTVVINPPGSPKHYVAKTVAYGLLRKPAYIYALRTTRPCGLPPKPGTSGR
jgi:hypothetical protein